MKTWLCLRGPAVQEDIADNDARIQRGRFPPLLRCNAIRKSREHWRGREREGERGRLTRSRHNSAGTYRSTRALRYDTHRPRRSERRTDTRLNLLLSPVRPPPGTDSSAPRCPPPFHVRTAHHVICHTRRGRSCRGVREVPSPTPLPPFAEVGG